MACRSITKTKPRSILKTLTLREQGTLKFVPFKESTLCSQLNNNPQKPHPIEGMHSIMKFEFVKADSDGNLIGVSHGNFMWDTTISSIYVMQFSYNPVCVRDPNNSNSIISSFRSKFSRKEFIVLTDIIDVQFGGIKPILYCGNSKKEGIVGLTHFNCEGRNLEHQWKAEGRTFCVTSCNFSKQFALGCEDGFYLFNAIGLSKKQETIDNNVLSIQCSNDGNFLILSTSKSGVYLEDNREHPCFRNKCSVKKDYGFSCRTSYSVRTTSPCIREMKLLEDQLSLICVDRKGFLEKVDLRMMKTVFSYMGHEGHPYKRSICLNEELDLVSAPGGDKAVRIWSLSSGKLNYERKLFDGVNKGPPHCCFISNQRRWFLSVIQDNALIPIGPNDEHADFSELYMKLCLDNAITLNNSFT